MNSASGTLLTSNPVSGLKDSDWEWEYDPDHTEDFYFTLDLTTNDPHALTDAGRVIFDNTPISNENPDSAAQTTPSTPTSVLNHSTQSVSPNQTAANSLQILDLHSDKPVVRLGESTYACQWMNDLGTQFYVARPGAVVNSLRPGYTVDIVGISNARLLARPAKIRPNKKWQEEMSRQALVDAEHTSIPEYGTNGASEMPLGATSSAGILSVPKHLIKDKLTESQASFLERMSAIKASKNQSPVVRMSEVRSYAPPSDITEIRRKADAESRAKTRHSPQKKSHKPVASKRRKTTNFPVDSTLRSDTSRIQETILTASTPPSTSGHCSQTPGAAIELETFTGPNGQG